MRRQRQRRNEGSRAFGPPGDVKEVRTADRTRARCGRREVAAARKATGTASCRRVAMAIIRGYALTHADPKHSESMSLRWTTSRQRTPETGLPLMF
jgi:hypothetical protein